MGLCCSSNERNKDISNNEACQGLPPKEIIPQPVEISNATTDLNTQIINYDNQNNKIEIIQNQTFNSINSTINPVSLPVIPSIKNVNNSSNNFNQNLNLDQSLGNTQFFEQNKNIIRNSYNEPSTQIKELFKNPQVLNSQLINSRQLGEIKDSFKQRLYIVVQLPGRIIEITKLYDNNTLLDIEPFIVPDSIDEFDIYDLFGSLINNYIYSPFKEWHDINRTLEIKLIRTGLYIPNDIRTYIAERTYLIGCLTFDRPNSLGLFIFNKINNSTLSFEYSTNFHPEMKIVNQFSSYCNALNKLYISGGEISNNCATDSFICIDLIELQKNNFFPIQLCNLQRGRYWHSMIFIPKKFIFIIGGPNEINVELYDIEKNVSKIDSQLNTERCEPSLILVNNKFLYAFFGFHLYETFINSIERCNIQRRRREWEIIEYKLKNTPNLIRGFFGVSYISNNIILVSDKENESDLKPNYLLSPGNGNIDTITDEGILNSKSLRLFSEKFFIPFNENESINLAFKSGEPKIFIINNNTGVINELYFKES